MLYIYQLVGKKIPIFLLPLSSQPNSIILLWLTRAGFCSNK